MDLLNLRAQMILVHQQVLFTSISSGKDSGAERVKNTRNSKSSLFEENSEEDGPKEVRDNEASDDEKCDFLVVGGREYSLEQSKQLGDWILCQGRADSGTTKTVLGPEADSSSSERCGFLCFFFLIKSKNKYFCSLLNVFTFN
jgi:hypothetical protein